MNLRQSTLVLALVALLTSVCAQAGTWSDLWWTRDQQAQQLLEANKPAEAAQVFQDTRHQGYAKLQAGQYEQAAKLLEGHADADSQYNRGNALAHAGHLQEALAAYDAALAKAPGNRDALRNRDLVQRALKDQNSTPQSSKDARGGRGTPHSGGSSGSRDGAGSADQTQRNQGAKAGAASQASGTDASKEGLSPNTLSQQQTAQSNHSSSPAQDKEGSHNPAVASNSTGSAASGDDGRRQPVKSGTARGPAESLRAQNQSAKAQEPSNSSNHAEDGHQGQQERGVLGTQTSSGQSGRATDPTAGPTELTNARAQHPQSLQPPKPPSEQALAMDQWLRTIPDDSGELLQRKFLIEHLMKQRESEP